MKKIVFALILSIAALAAIFAFPSSGAAEPEQNPPDNPFAVNLKVEKFTLENGMRFLVVQRKNAPVFYMHIGFDVGSMDEVTGTSGVAHIIEHMFSRGTKTIGTKDWSKEEPLLKKIDETVERANIEKIKIYWNEYNYDTISEVVGRAMLIESAALGTQVEFENSCAMNQQSLSDLAKTLFSAPSGESPEAARWIPLKEQWAAVFTEITKIKKSDSWPVFMNIKQLEKERHELEKEADSYIVENEFDILLEKNGARGKNASTSNEWTGYYYGLPKNRLELFFAMESDKFQNPAFRGFYKELDVVKEEERMRVEDNPQGQLSLILNGLAFISHPYGRPIIGWKSDLEMLTRPKALEFYREFYVPNNAVCVLVGDVEKMEVKKLAEKYFGPIPRGKEPRRVTTRELEQRGERRGILKYPSDPMIWMAYHRPAVGHPDMYVLDVVSQILGYGRTSRLYKSVVETRKAAYCACSNQDTKCPALFVFYSAPLPGGNVSEIEPLIYAEIDRLISDGVTDRELEQVKNTVTVEFLKGMESSEDLATTLAHQELRTGSWEFLMEYPKVISKITSEDVKRVAKKYFTPENRTIAILEKTTE